jgi:diguanylate cyclase (GGDEF)-like protein
VSIRVLVVDDSATIRHKLKTLLTQNGMEVEIARNGSDALERMDPAHPFDVAITDLRMPGLDGGAFVSSVQKEDWLSTLPVIVLTSSTSKEDHVRNLENGAAAFLTKPWDDDVLVATVRRHARQHSRSEELTRDSRVDGLTKLFNRRYGSELLGHEIERSRKYDRMLAVALIDIDHFKRVNDTLGHPAGDAVLVAMSAELQRASRDSDVVVRWGGEEFLFAFPNTDLSKGVGIIERFRKSLASMPITVPSGEEVTVTISGGVAELERSDTVDALVARADDALYRAKESGRNRLMIWQLGQLLPVPAA